MRSLDIVILHGDKNIMTNVFTLAENNGGGALHELNLMFGLIVGAVLKYVRPFSEGNYLLSDKGMAKREYLMTLNT